MCVSSTAIISTTNASFFQGTLVLCAWGLAQTLATTRRGGLSCNGAPRCRKPPGAPRARPGGPCDARVYVLHGPLLPVCVTHQVFSAVGAALSCAGPACAVPAYALVPWVRHSLISCRLSFAILARSTELPVLRSLAQFVCIGCDVEFWVGGLLSRAMCAHGAQQRRRVRGGV